MKKLFALFACLALPGLFTSCVKEEDYGLRGALSDHVLRGDLGFVLDGIYPLESAVYFDPSGFGDDELYFEGEYVYTLDIRWDLDDDTIYIDYGNADYPRLLTHTVWNGNSLTADLYIAGKFFGRRYYHIDW